MAKSGLHGVSPEETFRRMFLPSQAAAAPVPQPETDPAPAVAQEGAIKEDIPVEVSTDTSTGSTDVSPRPQGEQPKAEVPSSPTVRNEQGTADTEKTKPKAAPPKGVKLYLSPELDDALAHRCYVDRSKNRSAHVRAALEEYLKEDLEAIQNETI